MTTMTTPRGSRQQAGAPAGHQPIVEELIALLKSRPDLAEALKESIRKAELPGIANLAQYQAFLDEMVTLIPTDRNLNQVINKFFYLIDSRKFPIKALTFKSAKILLQL